MITMKIRSTHGFIRYGKQFLPVTVSAALVLLFFAPGRSRFLKIVFIKNELSHNILKRDIVCLQRDFAVSTQP